MTTRVLVAAMAALFVVSPSAAQAGRHSPVELKAPKKAKASSLVTFEGRAGAGKGDRVSVQRRQGRKWKAIASGRTAKRGRYAFTWIAPSKRAKVVVRAVVGRKRSKVRRLRVLPPKSGAPKVTVSPKTRIISPSTVQSVPDAGKPGEVSYAGGNDVKSGAIVVIGRGANTPNGFIGRVTEVESKNGQTVAETAPATLFDAVPQGSIDLVAKPVTATGARSGRLRASKITCEGSAGVSITPDVSFTAGLAFAGSWPLFKELQSASVTATANLDASLKAIAEAAGSCSLAKRSLFKVKGPSVSGFVGPVPVVMTSDLTVYLDANASAQASISTGANAGFTASAGVAYTKVGGFTGTQSFTPHFGFDPPTLSSSANIGAHLTPTVDVLLYGVVGPKIALKTGVDFAANTTQDPWWTLSVPVDLTASIAIPALDLSSPELHVYQQDFPIADAGGPFGSTPAPVPTDVTNVATPATSLAAGYDQSCALRPDGTAACWGGNAKGQLGNGKTAGSSVPVPVSGATDAAAIAAGNDHSCLLRVKGEVRCWGDNVKGDLGDGTTTSRSTPVVVAGVANATAIAVGAEHSCALLVTGRVRCWGSYGSSEISGVTNATAIASNTFNTCAVRKDGTISCWDSSSTSQPVNAISDATAVSVGTNHACALRAGGTVACWGDNFYGQLGTGTTTDSADPVAVRDLSGVVAIESGGAHTCAVLSSGSLKCWGWNNYGQLGDGSMTNRTTPVTVSGITDATAVTGGLEHTCASLKSGGLRCWGYGGDGELGNNTTTTSATPVPVSSFSRRAGAL